MKYVLLLLLVYLLIDFILYLVVPIYIILLFHRS